MRENKKRGRKEVVEMFFEGILLGSGFRPAKDEVTGRKKKGGQTKQ